MALAQGPATGCSAAGLVLLFAKTTSKKEEEEDEEEAEPQRQNFIKQKLPSAILGSRQGFQECRYCL